MPCIIRPAIIASLIMSDAGANPQPTGESKSARKKKAKAAVPAVEKASSDGTPGSDHAKSSGADGSSEHSYVKELQKSIRNINKKLNLMQKVDAIIDANPGVSLDDLVASRKINNDQKASALKKPHLQAQLQQLEEQITQYRKFDQEYQDKIAKEKEILQRSHSEELEKLRDTLKAEAELQAKKVFRENTLTLSRFLRAAAARRQLEDQESDLTKAFEGALLQVYGGDASAVSAVEKLIDGSSDHVPSTEGDDLSVTYAEIKEAALKEAPFAAEEAWVDDVAQSQPAPPEESAEHTDSPTAVTDPTIANAGMTELQDSAVTAGEQVQDASAPAATSVDNGAANAAAEEHWDKTASSPTEPLAESFEMIPRNPQETETSAPPAAVGSTQSWADDAHEAAAAPAPAPAAASGNEGFSEVHHGRASGRGRGDGRGGYRGRGGPRGEGRGRGGRGRGRGDYRGGQRGSFRGSRGGAGSVPSVEAH
ncbi:hypothetical protein M011DRAFT_170515 [Sporormia fimetaria CBS 119925]|uniref:YAG7-like dimerisation domain-containing protein n=1 Tax=Sporormia fimetaria CBS 119925 TaxID=1340428 RepID=A0A6A6V3I9_9PLEO|nr:hypothetical protein M011DRAFT_170515 [Sporormia fimetaria CBS 119925]